VWGNAVCVCSAVRLGAARAQVKRMMEEAEHLAEARAQVCVDMAEKKGRITALEVECATLKQVGTGNYLFLS
jgi:hypothetical protein